MLENYLPIMILVGVAVIVAFLFMILSRIIGPYRPNVLKLGPYESGMDPVGQARERYSVSFYLVAMEFIVFDLEVVFLYPWAVRFLKLGIGTFIAMMLFLVILFLGLIYTLKKGTLDWDFKQIKK
ncbi:MAG TPA: NADH-quinone oxidoreductase subunit A [Balneolales bacterium]|jgi:NADH-quinone oxidoreductase subunit A|nr:NADH-quinone oxidoreductase subunit A [Balneolales bacterium]